MIKSKRWDSVQLVSVARLVSALETLLPITTTATAKIATKTTTTSSVVAGDRNASSFSLADIAVGANIIADGVDGGKDAKGITEDDVRTLLQSTREGKVIDIRTVTHLIEGATKHFQTRHPHWLVTLPPLREEQQLSVIGDLHGSLSDLATVLAYQAGDDTINSKLDGSHKIDADTHMGSLRFQRRWTNKYFGMGEIRPSSRFRALAKYGTDRNCASMEIIER